MQPRQTPSLRARLPVFFLTSIFALAFPAGADEVPNDPNGTGNAGYRVSEQTLIIEGRTRGEVLLREIGDPTGRLFPSRAAVEAFVSERAKKLENLRAFSESSVRAVYGETAADGVTPVTLEVSVTDGSVFVPIPYAFYNSNEGFMAGVIGNVPNVSGTLRDLIVIGMYSAPPDENDNLQWTEPNFMCLVSWSGVKAGTADLSVFGGVMKMTRELMDLGVLRGEYDEFAVSLAVKAKRPLADALWATASVSGFLGIDRDVAFVVDPSLYAYGPVDSRFGASAGVLTEDIDWTGNFRDGYKAHATVGWERTNPAYADPRDDFLVEAEAAYHRRLNGRFNPNVRMYGFANTGLPLTDAAKRVRGVRNGELRGNEGIAINAGLQIFAARAGSAEFHVLPYIDAIALHTRDADKREYDYGLACGAELLAFVDSIKSLPIKIGFGYDLRPAGKNGSGKFYEVDFTFQLTY